MGTVYDQNTINPALVRCEFFSFVVGSFNVRIQQVKSTFCHIIVFSFYLQYTEMEI